MTVPWDPSDNNCGALTDSSEKLFGTAASRMSIAVSVCVVAVSFTRALIVTSTRQRQR